MLCCVFCVFAHTIFHVIHISLLFFVHFIPILSTSCRRRENPVRIILGYPRYFSFEIFVLFGLNLIPIDLLHFAIDACILLVRVYRCTAVEIIFKSQWLCDLLLSESLFMCMYTL